MATAIHSSPGGRKRTLPSLMTAAVYRGVNDVRIEEVPVPKVGAGEVLIKVHTCGICGTDLKKIHTGSHSAPRIFGHETSGTIVAVGEGVTKFAEGDRVMVFHHIPCGHCFYCRHKVFAQCPVYKKVGATAGFEPSGGGFAEYVLAMDWIVDHGVVKIPDGISFEQAAFVEPMNTCLKGIRSLALERGSTVLVIGQGPIGIIMALLAQREGAQVLCSDLYQQRLSIAQSYGLTDTIDALKTDVVAQARAVTEGRGADTVILAVGGNALIRTAIDAARPGGKVMLFAQTQRSEATIDPSSVCVDEKTLIGSYSASVDLQDETIDVVFQSGIDLGRLISHRFALKDAIGAIDLASHPQPESMKIVIQPESL